MGRRLRHKRPPQWVLRWNRRKKNLATDKERLIKQIGEHDSSMDYMFLKEQSNGELLVREFKNANKHRFNLIGDA